MADIDSVKDLILFNGVNKKTRFEAVLAVLDSSLFVLFDELFTRGRYFDLGAEFVEICMQEVNGHRYEIESWRYERFLAKLYRLKLKMLDYKNEWGKYLSFTQWVLENFKAPYSLNLVYPIEPRYVYEDNGEKYVHFLYQDTPRYEIIRKKLEKQLAGKNVEHLKRHQQSELTDEYIASRMDSIVKFFAIANFDFNNKKWR